MAIGDANIITTLHRVKGAPMPAYYLGRPRANWARAGRYRTERTG
ncbi:MAG: hypothetical protein AAGA99_09390 [Actinomycetota bacterium]